VLLLCVGLSEEILAEIASLQAAVASVKSLYEVVAVLAEAKRYSTAAKKLFT
jgi:hypothetical protein